MSLQRAWKRRRLSTLVGAIAVFALGGTLYYGLLHPRPSSFNSDEVSPPPRASVRERYLARQLCYVNS